MNESTPHVPQLLGLRPFLSYFGVQITLTITSFVTIPFLARVLGPDTWGVLVLAQALNAALVILIEYGFTMTGARAVAQGRMQLPMGGGRVAGIYAARGVLAVLAALAGLLMLGIVPAFQAHPLYLNLAVSWALFAGLGPWWYFLGREDLTRPAALAITTRLLATTAIFIVVRTPDDGWLVLAAYALASLVDTVVMTVWISRDGGVGSAPAWSEIVGLLVEGAPVFAKQAGSALFGAAGTLVLGAVATPTQVAYYGGGEKIARLGRQLLNTVSRVIFPRMSALESADSAKAARCRRRLLCWSLGLAISAAAAGILLAPLAVAILFGPEYESVVPVLRIMLLAAPFMAITDIIGTQGLLARGNDRAFAFVAVTVSAAGLGVSAALAFSLSYVGMAIGATLTEVTMTVAMIVAWRRT